MSNNHHPRPSVPSDLYTTDYYLTDCGGFEEFIESRGQLLSLRLSKALELGAVRPGEKVLDIGCGRGEIMLHCLHRSAHPIGIDYSRDALQIADNLLKEAGHSPTLLCSNATTLCFPDNHFDVVFLLDVIEHLFPWEVEKMLSEVHRVLRYGGRLIIHTAPNRTYVDYGFRFYTRHWHRLINHLFDRDHSVDLRPGLAEQIHVNELTLSELKTVLSGFGRRRVWLEVYLGQVKSLRAMIRGAITNLYPLSVFWPLNRLFAYWIWAIAEKPPLNAKRRR